MNKLATNISGADLRQKLRPRPTDGHKGTFGHALLVAGSKNMAGAAILAGEACLRSGIGKLSIYTPEENRTILQTALPEAIIKDHFPCDDRFEGVGIGPGIGINPDLLHRLLSADQMAKVLDADALNTVAQNRELEKLIPTYTILTPHPGEAMRLIGSSKLEDVAAYARTHCVYVVLKGHPTHVCTPEGDVFRLNVGNAGMATAGSGDVLTGIITGLMAQGYASREAALLGVWLHGTAGDFAADEMGENCMLARDIIRHLPNAFRKLKQTKI